MGKLIDKKVTTINVLKDDDGRTVITPEQQEIISNFKSRSITEECPACDGDGVCGGDYCDVCHGRGKFTYYTELKIIPLSKLEMTQLKFNELKGAELAAFKKENADQLFFSGENKDWKKIPKDIKAITIDSNGKIGFYSGVSGIYRRYDDEHTEHKKYKGGQYWYYGTSLPGLDITDKHKDLKILVKKERTCEQVFYRPGEERIVLDFEKPFDWRIFPPAVTKLFVAFGDMNITNHELTVVAGSEEIYLRNDNVIWGYDGRTHVDKSFDIDLCRPWINDGTNAYPVRKDSMNEVGFNNMNLELRNIPLRTDVFELPKDRSKPVAAIKLKTLYNELTSRINETTRLISERLTVGPYHFWYPEGSKEHEIEYWLLTNATHIGGAYEITQNEETGEYEIDVEGDVRMQKRNGELSELKYKFGFVQGTFTFLGENIESLKNLPSKCYVLIISHSKSLKRIEVPATEVTWGILRLQFLKKIEYIGNLHSSITNIDYYVLDNLENIEFDKKCAGLEIKYERKEDYENPNSKRIKEQLEKIRGT